MRCPRCRTENDAASVRCAGCGVPIVLPDDPAPVHLDAPLELDRRGNRRRDVAGVPGVAAWEMEPPEAPLPRERRGEGQMRLSAIAPLQPPPRPSRPRNGSAPAPSGAPGATGPASSTAEGVPAPVPIARIETRTPVPTRRVTPVSPAAPSTRAVTVAAPASAPAVPPAPAVSPAPPVSPVPAAAPAPVAAPAPPAAPLPATAPVPIGAAAAPAPSAAPPTPRPHLFPEVPAAPARPGPSAGAVPVEEEPELDLEPDVDAIEVHLRRAAPWRRVASWLVDLAFLGLFVTLLLAPVLSRADLPLDGTFDGLVEALTRRGSVLQPALALALLAAFAYQWLGLALMGATPGSRLLGLRVAGPDGRRPSPGRSALRAALSLPSFLFLGLGLLLGLFTRSGRALHDFGAGTWVVQAP